MDPPDLHRQPAQPAQPAALPQLDLHSHEPPRTQRVVLLKTSALERGIRTSTCPQCGQNPTTTVAQRTFQYVPPWVYVGVLANVVILAILYVVARRVVKGELSLCADCDAADRRARRLQSLSVVGLAAFPFLMGAVAGSLFGFTAGLWGAAAGVVSGLALIVAAQRATRAEAIQCTLIDKKTGTLTLKAGEPFAGVLADEAPDALR